MADVFDKGKRSDIMRQVKSKKNKSGSSVECVGGRFAENQP